MSPAVPKKVRRGLSQQKYVALLPYYYLQKYLSIIIPVAICIFIQVPLYDLQKADTGENSAKVVTLSSQIQDCSTSYLYLPSKFAGAQNVQRRVGRKKSHTRDQQTRQKKTTLTL